MSGEEIYRELQHLESQGVCYAGDKTIASQCKFTFNKSVEADVLVPKNAEESISEFILLGVF
jgi:hypothetical protein